MNDVGEALLPLVEKVSTDRFEELESMCERASVSQYNARSRFRRLLDSMSFSPETPWSGLVTIIAFTGHVAVHCANHNMEEQLVEVVDEADKFLREKLPPWIIARAAEGSLLSMLKTSKPTVSQGLSFLQAATYAFLGVSPGCSSNDNVTK
jgi:hypothetical protein